MPAFTINLQGGSPEGYFKKPPWINSVFDEKGPAREAYMNRLAAFSNARMNSAWEMNNANSLIGNTKNDNSKFCSAKSGELYHVYLPNGGEARIDLAGGSGKFGVNWFNPREGGASTEKGGAVINGGVKGTLDARSGDDWLAVIKKE